MDLYLLISLIFPLLVIFLLHSHKRLRNTTPHPPGPPGLPFIGNLHQFDSLSPHIYLWKLSKRYGPLFSLKLGSLPVLVISSPKILKEVIKNHDLAISSRPKFSGQHRLFYNGLDVAFSPYGELWRELRKICVLHLLSNKQVQSFRPIREEETFRMIRNIEVSGDNGAITNLSETMLALTSTLICRVAFGKMLHDEEGLKGRRFDELMIEAQAMQGGFFLSDYMPWFAWVDKLSGMMGRLDKVSKDLDEFYQELIDEHLEPSRQRSVNPDILDLLIQLKEDKTCSIDLTWDHVKAILMDVFIAGTDTGAAAVVWTMTALMKNPTSMQKLQNEIRELVGGKGKVDEDDLSKLPYLKAVIKESLRLYPPAPLLIPRETREKCDVNGYTIPPKTVVYINAWAIARDPEYWANPNEFLPERFLGTTIDILGQDFQVVPFGAGRRGCPGIAMGLAMVELALANLLYSFDWELPLGMKKEDIDTEVMPGITMHKKNPLCLVPKIYRCS